MWTTLSKGYYELNQFLLLLRVTLLKLMNFQNLNVTVKNIQKDHETNEKCNIQFHVMFLFEDFKNFKTDNYLKNYAPELEPILTRPFQLSRAVSNLNGWETARIQLVSQLVPNLSRLIIAQCFFFFNSPSWT